MICLPLRQFMALMEAWGQDTPPVVTGLVVLWRITHWWGIRLAGSQTLHDVLGTICLTLASWRAWISLLPSFLGEMEDGKACIAEMREQKRQLVLCFSNKEEVKVRGARYLDEHNSRLSLPVRKENDLSSPSQADSFLATGLRITLKWTVKYKVHHLTVWHIVFPWHLITYPFLQLFVLSQMSQVNAWINEDGSHHFHDMLQNIHRWCFKACHLPQ